VYLEITDKKHNQNHKHVYNFTILVDNHLLVQNMQSTKYSNYILYIKQILLPETSILLTMNDEAN